jgi:hypothetical protein
MGVRRLVRFVWSFLSLEFGGGAPIVLCAFPFCLVCYVRLCLYSCVLILLQVNLFCVSAFHPLSSYIFYPYTPLLHSSARMLVVSASPMLLRSACSSTCSSTYSFITYPPLFLSSYPQTGRVVIYKPCARRRWRGHGYKSQSLTWPVSRKISSSLPSFVLISISLGCRIQDTLIDSIPFNYFHSCGSKVYSSTVSKRRRILA